MPTFITPGAVEQPGNGGSLPSVAASCVFVSSRDTPLDIHDEAVYQLKPALVVDNVWDFNTLAEIPDGMGFTVAIDGSSGDFTFTETGMWAWTLLVDFESGNDATFTGEVASPFGDAKMMVGPLVGAQIADANATPVTLSSPAVVLPAGASGGFFVKTSTSPTTDPYNISWQLIFSRLA